MDENQNPQAPNVTPVAPAPVAPSPAPASTPAPAPVKVAHPMSLTKIFALIVVAAIVIVVALYFWGQKVANETVPTPTSATVELNTGSTEIQPN